MKKGTRLIIAISLLSLVVFLADLFTILGSEYPWAGSLSRWVYGIYLVVLFFLFAAPRKK